LMPARLLAHRLALAAYTDPYRAACGRLAALAKILYFITGRAFERDVTMDRCPDFASSTMPGCAGATGHLDQRNRDAMASRVRASVSSKQQSRWIGLCNRPFSSQGVAGSTECSKRRERLIHNPQAAWLVGSPKASCPSPPGLIGGVGWLASCRRRLPRNADPQRTLHQAELPAHASLHAPSRFGTVLVQHQAGRTYLSENRIGRHRRADYSCQTCYAKLKASRLPRRPLGLKPG